MVPLGSLVLALFAAGVPPGAGPVHSARFEHLTVEQGLSSNFVQDMLQDRDGYLWFATEDGLNRYDGESFVLYQLDPDDRSSLPGNYIDRLLEASNGDLWIVLGVGGVARLQRGSGRLTGYRKGSTPGLVHDAVTALVETRDGSIWVGTLGGVCRIDADTGMVTGIATDPGPGGLQGPVGQILETRKAGLFLAGQFGVQRYDETRGVFSRVDLGGSSVVVSFLHEDQDGHPWVVTTDGSFLRFDLQKGSFGSVPLHRDDVPSFSSLVSVHATDGQGRLWCVPFQGPPVRFDPRTRVLDRPLSACPGAGSYHGAVFREVLVDRAGVVWLGTPGGGLLRFDEETKTLVRYQHRPTDPASLCGDNVAELFEDESGLLWVACHGRGVSVLDPRKQEFVHVKHDPGREESLPPAAVTAFAGGEAGELLLGTLGAGLVRFDPRTHEVTRLGSVTGARDTSGLCIRSLLVDGAGRLWVGTDGAGVVMSSLEDLAGAAPGELDFLRYRRLHGERVLCLTRSRSGSVWIGHDGIGGITLLDPDTGQVRRYSHDPERADSLPATGVWTLLEENEETLWVGMPGAGLLRMDVESGSVYQYPWDPEDPTTLNNRTVNSLLLDRQGRLWVGTYSGGLDLLDRETDTFRHFTRRAGLPSNMINGILESDAGRLWLATNRGLCVFDPGAGVVERVYTTQDGLQGLEFRRGATLLDSRGHFLFGGENGFNDFHPAALTRNTRPPPLVITSAKIQGRETWSWGTDPLLERRLPHTENYLSFEFAALDYTNPSRNRYRYRLEGLDPSWTESGVRRFASYPNLPPGRYLLRVQACNSDGVWNREGVAYAFTIVPPFWRTAWFRWMGGMAGVLIAFAAYRARVRTIEARKRVLEKLVVEKTTELRGKNRELERLNADKSELVRIAAHDMRTPLTSIGAYLGLTLDTLEEEAPELRDVLRDLEEAKGATRRVSRLLDSMLDTAAIEEGKLVLLKESSSLVELLEERCRFHRRLSEHKGIALRLDHDEFDVRVVMDRDRMGEVVDNLLSNAVKYTHSGGEILVSLECGAGEVVVSVKDSGQGLTSEDLGRVFGSFEKLSARPTGGEASTGLGLAIVKKIVELHGGRVGVESEKGVGSRFFFGLWVEEKGAGVGV